MTNPAYPLFDFLFCVPIHNLYSPLHVIATQRKTTETQPVCLNTRPASQTAHSDKQNGLDHPTSALQHTVSALRVPVSSTQPASPKSPDSVSILSNPCCRSGNTLLSATVALYRRFVLLGKSVLRTIVCAESSVFQDQGRLLRFNGCAVHG